MDGSGKPWWDGKEGHVEIEQAKCRIPLPLLHLQDTWVQTDMEAPNRAWVNVSQSSGLRWWHVRSGTGSLGLEPTVCVFKVPPRQGNTAPGFQLCIASEAQPSTRHSLSHVHSLISFFPFLIEHTVQRRRLQIHGFQCAKCLPSLFYHATRPLYSHLWYQHFLFSSSTHSFFYKITRAKCSQIFAYIGTSTACYQGNTPNRKEQQGRSSPTVGDETALLWEGMGSTGTSCH